MQNNAHKENLTIEQTFIYGEPFHIMRCMKRLIHTASEEWFESFLFKIKTVTAVKVRVNNYTNTLFIPFYKNS